MPDESDERGGPDRSAGSREDPDERLPPATEDAPSDGADDGTTAGANDERGADGADEELCAALTNDGSRCTRAAVSGRYCWQHREIVEREGEDAVTDSEDAGDDRSDPGSADETEPSADEIEPGPSVATPGYTSHRGASRYNTTPPSDGHPDADSTDHAAESDADEGPSNADEGSPDGVDPDDEAGTTDDTESTVDASEDDSATASERPAVETDGEGVAGGQYVGEQLRQYEPTTPTRGTGKRREQDDDLGGLSTPPDDEEMPLADHIEEMILRLAVVFLFGAAGTAIGLLWASDAIAFIWADVIPEASERPPHLYHPLELWLTRIKVSALLGIMVALPVFVYQCYLFMRPGLYPHERKYYLAAVPTSVVLAGVGMVFSYLIILPILFSYFTFYSRESAAIAFGLGVTFDLVITLTGFLAIVFQIPLFIMLAIMMGVTTRQWLADKRLYFWAAFAGLSFMFTFDPTFMAPVFVAITMIVLFEGTLLLLRWTGR